MIRGYFKNKNRILLSVLIIFLILALTGCGMIPPNDSLESMAEDTVYHYWQAIINRQYELAKYYCVIDGVWYNKVDEWEEYINTNSEGEASTLVWFNNFYKPIEIVGNTIIVYVEISVDKIAFPGCSEINVDTFEYEMEIIEIPSLGRLKLK